MRAMFERPPGVLFHAVVLGAVGWIVVIWRTPGPDWLSALPAVWVLFVAAIVWFVRLVVCERARHQGRERRRLARFLVAPAVGVVMLGALWIDLPVRVHWALSKPAFEALARTAPPAKDAHEWVALDVPERVGGYRITRGNRVGAALIFFEASGYFVDDAGFAFLPGGPSEALAGDWFESPKFKSLGDHWYAWTASW